MNDQTSNLVAELLACLEWRRVGPVSHVQVIIGRSGTFWEILDTLKSGSATEALVQTQQSKCAIDKTRDAEHCDYPDCEQHWTHVVAQARALLEPLADCDPAIRQWLATPDLPAIPLERKSK